MGWKDKKYVNLDTNNWEMMEVVGGGGVITYNYLSVMPFSLNGVMSLNTVCLLTYWDNGTCSIIILSLRACLPLSLLLAVNVVDKLLISVAHIKGNLSTFYIYFMWACQDYSYHILWLELLTLDHTKQSVFDVSKKPLNNSR